ncbi:aryl hydrocarbon receptor-like isoform 2-T2 [Aulostomus maculatus]
MLGNAGVYAVKRRKKPVQKSAQPPPVKTNPSKRHRDRLNVELDYLTSLLPFSEEVRGRLDKLSVLRLSVGYLKVKSYFHRAPQNNSASAPPVSSNGRNGRYMSLDGVSFSEGEFLLQSLNGFVLVVATDGTVFYTSPTIQDFLGFHQSDVVHQSVYDLIHVDDREMFHCQLQIGLQSCETDMRTEDVQSSRPAAGSSPQLLPGFLPPENSFFLERSFCCRLRCLLDNTSGFMALNFSGRLKYLRGQRAAGADGKPPLALFTVASPLQPPAVMEIRIKTLIFQTKHRMDFAPMSIDTRGKLLLGYSDKELLTIGSGYQFIHAADMMYCADNHIRMMKTGDTGFTFFRLLTKTGRWLWVQASARIVFKGGRPDFIIARQKVLTDNEGEEHLRQRRQQLPFNLATGEGVLYDVSLDVFSTPGEEPTVEEPVPSTSLLGSLRRQDHSVYTQTQSPPLPVLTTLEDPEQAFLDSHVLLSVPGQLPVKSGADLTSQAMIDSLEQILGDIGDGGVEGLDVEEAELRNWENTITRVTKGKEEQNHILANDVFSYVEEALMRETAGGCMEASNQIRPHEVPGPGSVFPNLQELTDTKPNGSVFTEMEGVFPEAPPAFLGHAPSLWPPDGSTHHYDNRMFPLQSCRSVTEATDQTSFAHVANAEPGQALHHAGSHTFRAPQLQSPPQRCEQHSHNDTHSSHTHGSPALHSFQLSSQPLSGSCMYERTGSGSTRLNGSPLTLSCTSNSPFGKWPAAAGSGRSTRIAAGPQDASLGHLGGDCLLPATAPSEFPSGNGSLPFFCWSNDAQISSVPLNGDLFPFPPCSAGSVNLSQNTGP